MAPTECRDFTQLLTDVGQSSSGSSACASARARRGTAHERAECALRDHPSHSRYLRQLPSGRLRIDRARVGAEERLDGKFLLETSDPDISAEDAALGYKNLLEAERSFRDLKGTLRIRPVFHRLEERIPAPMS